MILLCVIVWVVVDQGFICVSSADREMSLICEECQFNVGGGVEGDFPEPRSHRVFLIHSTDTSDNPFYSMDMSDNPFRQFSAITASFLDFQRNATINHQRVPQFFVHVRHDLA